MVANALARLARAVLGAGAGRMRNRIVSCMSLGRATCMVTSVNKGNSYIEYPLDVYISIYRAPP